MLEHGIQNEIRNDLAGDCLAFRANVGQGWTGKAQRINRPCVVEVGPGDVVIHNARPFNTGLPKGFSDLFGLVSVTITPDMVGQTFARFFGLEVKTPKGRATGDQSNFLGAVDRKGGLSGVVRSPADARRVLGLEPRA